MRWAVLLLVALAIGVVLVWWPRASHEDVLDASAVPAELTASELAGLPDRQVPERINQECQRRMIAANVDGDWSVGVDILPIKAGAMYVVARFEADMAFMNFAQRLRGDADLEVSKSGPTCAQAAAAYDRLGMTEVAVVVRAAASIPGPWPEDDNRIRNQEWRYRKLIGAGSEARLIAYAKSNRRSLLE